MKKLVLLALITSISVSSFGMNKTRRRLVFDDEPRKEAVTQEESNRLDYDNTIQLFHSAAKNLSLSDLKDLHSTVSSLFDDRLNYKIQTPSANTYFDAIKSAFQNILDKSHNHQLMRLAAYAGLKELETGIKPRENNKKRDDTIQALSGSAASKVAEYLMYFNNDDRLLLAPRDLEKNPEVLIKNIIDSYKKMGILNLNVSDKAKNALKVYLSQRSNIDQLRKPNEQDKMMTDSWIMAIENHITMLNSKADLTYPVIKKKKNDDKENVVPVAGHPAPITVAPLISAVTPAPKSSSGRSNNTLRSLR